MDNVSVLGRTNDAVRADRTSSGKEHFEVLDGLRGSAAFLIVIFHLFNYAFGFNSPLSLVRHAYASVYRTGLVELQKYGEALGPLDEAIKVSKDKPEVAYPTIAINAKIEALSGLGRSQEALALASEAMQRASSHHLAGHLYGLYQARASDYGRMGQWDRAADDYSHAIQLCKAIVILARRHPGGRLTSKGISATWRASARSFGR